jgi:4-alpha-glucanotransferase
VTGRRRSGLLVPLFSLTSTSSWGVGEYLDLPRFAQWAAVAGQAFVQILPITEVPEAETSPYSALTAMALDPIYISLPALDDFQALGGEANLGAVDRAALDRLRAAPRVAHQEARRLKSRCLRRAFQRFEHEGKTDPGRVERYAAFVTSEAWWLDDYVLFHALRTRFRLKPWWDWPERLKRRESAALEEAREGLEHEIAYLRYLQWVAAEQWADARRQSRPLQIFGDLPFMISADSPDVWTQQNEFRFDATVGVPPDAFSETGQDWGLPPWRWDVMAQDGYEWMERRARRTASLFDGFRLDHLVGLYRIYVRPLDPAVKPFFAPADEAQQQQVGERLVGIYRDTGAEIVAEDLGTVPDFVRRSLNRMGVPGFKVVRWERQWSAPGQPFIDPEDYPEMSVATTGTHDIEPLICWWETLPSEERALVLQMPSVQRYLSDARAAVEHPSGLTSREVIDSLVRALLDSRSRIVIIPIQDIFGWRDRINTPARVDEENWTWRLPWRVDEMREIPDAIARAESLASWTKDAGRGAVNSRPL